MDLRIAAVNIQQADRSRTKERGGASVTRPGGKSSNTPSSDGQAVDGIICSVLGRRESQGLSSVIRA